MGSNASSRQLINLVSLWEVVWELLGSKLRCQARSSTLLSIGAAYPVDR